MIKLPSKISSRHTWAAQRVTATLTAPPILEGRFAQQGVAMERYTIAPAVWL